MAVALGGLPVPKHFDTIGEPETLEQRWKEYKEDIETYLLASGVTDGTQRRALLLHIGGKGLKEIYLTKPADDRAAAGQKSEYDKAIDIFDAHYKLKKNVPKARQTFMEITPSAGETILNFVTRLQVQAQHCEFQELDAQVRDKVLFYIKDQHLKGKLLCEKDLTTNKLMEIVSNHHEKSAMILQAPASGQALAVRSHQQSNNNAQPKKTVKCYACGIKGHVKSDCRRSPGHTCEKCGHLGHYPKCCRVKPADYKKTASQGQGQKQKKKFHKGNQRALEEGEDQAVESIQEGVQSFHIFSASGASKRKYEDMYKFEVNNVVKIPFVIDSGAHHNTLSEEDFQIICQHTSVDLEKATTKLYAYASTNPIELLGQCCLKIGIPKSGNAVTAKFFVTVGGQVSLLSNKTSKELGVLKINVVNSIQGESEWVRLQKEFPATFKGLGKLQGYQLKLKIDDSVTPCIQKVRRIPFCKRGEVTKKLEELVALDVIEKVTSPSRWVNPLVAVSKKPEDGNQKGDIRICVDMRRANEAIIRERHPVPTVEETVQEMHGGKYFSKLDLNMAYHQIELHKDSREITTFAGPDSLYRYKRLIFGINMASEKFQQIVSQVIRGCPGAYNMSDDIVVVGRTEQEHDERLYKVVKTLAENGLTLNPNKCKIKLQSIKYMGHVISSNGLEVSSDKVTAIVKAPRPKDQFEVRSFLGLAQFCSKFVPHFATVTSSLWDLTKQDSQFKWGDTEESAFQTLKKHLCQAPVMAYFSVGAKTRLTVDASPVGLGAILEQQQPDGAWRPIYFASRKTSAVESRYSQFEREALAVYWACKKFHLYLSGSHFEIRTDNKALLRTLLPNSTPPSARLERWILYLQQYNYTLSHISGSANQADALSRLPVKTEDDDASTEEYVYSVALDAVPNAISPRSFEDASKADITLEAVRNAIISNDWTSLNGTQFKAVKDELCIAGFNILRGNRLVVPSTLQKTILDLAHEGHQGIVRTKARLRSKCWWPEMDKSVEKMIKSCYPCQLMSPCHTPEPLCPTTLPDKPWSYLTIDLLEIPEGNHLLVLVDYYSKWPEVVQLTRTRACDVIKALKRIFRTHGLPERIRSDNGPPFASAEFEEFLKNHNIIHLKGIPSSSPEC